MVRKLKTTKTPAAAGNQEDILRQAQDMQKKMLEIQEELKAKELEASVGGGAVIAKVNGQKELLAVKLSEDILKEGAQDKEMLEDLILSAVREAMRQADELAEAEMNKVTGGVSIPGLF
ncbi:MAG: YbaB/EbfC family nucleoid-associated protein [Fusobacteriaceae bacterium]|jgi:DNA-binding YbaB/EbfC family protein|nr:YbaB/EbfC family nucleoid-associated protein [Fusobacteriaceae bacterium]